MIKICYIIISPELLEAKAQELYDLEVGFEKVDDRTFLLWGLDSSVRSKIVDMFPKKDRIIY